MKKRALATGVVLLISLFGILCTNTYASFSKSFTVTSTVTVANVGGNNQPIDIELSSRSFTIYNYLSKDIDVKIEVKGELGKYIFFPQMHITEGNQKFDWIYKKALLDKVDQKNKKELKGNIKIEVYDATTGRSMYKHPIIKLTMSPNEVQQLPVVADKHFTTDSAVSLE